MKTFLRENKLRLWLLGAPVLFLIVLWNINIYKVWWGYFTPWEYYGSPPGIPIGKFGEIDFPYGPSQDSIPHYFSNDRYPTNLVSASRPDVYVYTRDDYQLYVLTSQGSWRAVEFVRNPPLSNFALIKNQQKCGVELSSEWNLPEEHFLNATSMDARGYCFSDRQQYAVYRIDQNGNVWEKYMHRDDPERLRDQISDSIAYFMIGIFILGGFWPLINVFRLMASLWKRIFDFDPFRLKPDYDAD